MKKVIFVFAALYTLTGAAQSDSLKMYTTEPISVYTKDYMRKYNDAKRLIVAVYPYALHSADLIDKIENNAAAIEKRRKQNKFYKESYEELKDKFKYVFYELYTEEGIMLMKLVHRETGMTVYEIAEKYRGKGNAEIFNVMGKIWDQDVHVKFDAAGDDKIAEHVIRDIQSGIVPFNNEPVIIDREEYKEIQVEEREWEKKNKENIKERNKLKKQREKEKRKKEREAGNESH